MVGTDVLLVDVLKVAINAHRESLPAAVKAQIEQVAIKVCLS